jgi:hypothetical protein
MDWIDRLRELLARDRTNLTDAELLELEAEIVAAFDEGNADDDSVGVTEADDVLVEAAAAISELRTDRASREEALETARARRAELAAQVHVAEDGDTDTDEGDEEADEPAEGDEPVEVPAEEGDEPAEEGEVADAALPIAASTEAPARTTPRPAQPAALSALRRSVPSRMNPRGRPDQTSGVRLTAAPDLRNIAAGAEFPDGESVSRAMFDRFDSIAGTSYDGPEMRLSVGRYNWQESYPQSRRLNAGDGIEATSSKIAAVVGAYPGDPTVERVQPDGVLTAAAGGLCAPVAIRYELETVSVADRPLRAALPAFDASRGGMQWNDPATLSSILDSSGSAALTIVSASQDASNTTKTVQEVACGTLRETDVQAISEQLKFSNFGDRYNPERMQQFMTLARAGHSRLCERVLFETMRSKSTLVNGGVVYLGAARQFLGNLLVAAEGMRYRHRMSEDATIRVVLPDWFEMVVATDLLFQAPGDDTVDRLRTRDWINSQLALANISTIYQLDDARTNDANGAGGISFGSQSAGSLLDYPGRMSVLMYPEGSFIFLDGGQLDFGIVRDSTLIAANRFQTFFEVFENVGFVGVEALNITVQICASGSAGTALASAKCGGAGS